MCRTDGYVPPAPVWHHCTNSLKPVVLVSSYTKLNPAALGTARAAHSTRRPQGSGTVEQWGHRRSLSPY